MNGLAQTSLIAHLGWTLLHFLWQGTLVGMLYLCLSRMLRHAAPQTRYSLALAALFTLMLLPLITFFYLACWNTASPQLPPSLRIAFITTTGSALHATLTQMLADRLTPFIPWVVIIWLGGVVLMGARALWGWRLATGLRRPLLFASTHPWQPLLDALAEKMQVKTTVHLIASARAHAPMVLGWLKPVILIPPSAVCGLSWRQAEMILAHELAHIRRHDYLFNLLQLVVETLLFYHPVVHWISRDARYQREFCCDDAVMETCSNRVVYLKALAELEDGRLHAAFNMAANGGSLLHRAYRLAHHSEPRQRLSGWTLVLLGLSAFIAVAGLMHSHATGHSFQSAQAVIMTPIQTRSPATGKPQPLAERPALGLRIKLAPTRFARTPAMARPRFESPQAVPVILSPIPPAPTPPSRPVTQSASGNPLASELQIIAAQPLPQPAYPYQVWRYDLGGTVQASFRISQTGRVRDINTEMVNGPMVLAGAVRAAISAWKFEPVQFKKKVISPLLSLRFTFVADSGHKPEGRCVELTGSHVCHWYQVSIQSFFIQDASPAVADATTLSASGYHSDGNVALRLANTAGQRSVFCQPGSNGCPVAYSEEHRQRIEDDFDQLGAAGLLPQY